MIGTIRKHSAWLWWFIVVATVISFVWWGASVPSRAGRGGGGGGDYGTVYGKKISAQEFADADHEVRLSVLFRYGQWPERISSLSKEELQKQIYAKILTNRKA